MQVVEVSLFAFSVAQRPPIIGVGCGAAPARAVGAAGTAHSAAYPKKKKIQ